MVRMSGNDEYPSGNFVNCSQLINWILDSGATCHMTLDVSEFIPCSLEDTEKHIEVADGHHVTEKQTGLVQIKMCGENRDTFIAMLHNVLLAPDLCEIIFSIVMLMNLGHTSLFHKGFCTVYFGEKVKMKLHYYIVNKGNMHFGGK